MDLITGGEGLVPAPPPQKEPDDNVVDGTEKLEGHLVKAIWRRSGLDRKKLRDIWWVFSTLPCARSLFLMMILQE